MHYYEGHASVGLCSFHIVGLTCHRMCGKTFHGSGQNEQFTDVVFCHFPYVVVERMLLPSQKMSLLLLKFSSNKKTKKLPFLFSTILVLQYITLRDIFSSVIRFNDLLKFYTVVSSLEDVQISRGFGSLVLCICLCIDNSSPDQNESETIVVTQIKGFTCLPVWMTVPESFKRKVLNVSCSTSSLHLCLSLQPFSVLFPPWFKWLLKVHYFSRTLFHSEQVLRVRYCFSAEK